MTGYRDRFTTTGDPQRCIATWALCDLDLCLIMHQDLEGWKPGQNLCVSSAELPSMCWASRRQTGLQRIAVAALVELTVTSFSPD